MPYYTTRKLRPNCYSAYGLYSRRYFAKCISKSKAVRQTKHIRKWFEALNIKKRMSLKMKK
jgi:hypothetical protein